ncbi:MAG: hypothetical protein U0228_24060 [Myxococcaceae bacterium]
MTPARSTDSSVRSVARDATLARMDHWDRLQHRWNMLQTEDIGRNKVDVAKLAVEVAELEKFVIYLAGKAALGEALTPEDPTLMQFVCTRDAKDPRRALVEIVGKLRDRTTPRIVPCPKCGAGVRDLHGITDEKCQFCGATVRTKD